jgi:hypothetical protein
MLREIDYNVFGLNASGDIVYEQRGYSMSHDAIIFTLPTDKNISAVKVAWKYREEEDGNDGND